MSPTLPSSPSPHPQTMMSPSPYILSLPRPWGSAHTSWVWVSLWDLGVAGYQQAFVYSSFSEPGRLGLPGPDR